MSALRSLLAVALLASPLGACKKKEPAPARRPNVVVVTVDTLRADRLGCYGFAEARTPHVDQLAAEGLRVERAVAATPITLPSHATIFTGLYPPAHGIRDNGRQRLPDEVVTLAERLKAEGYRTQAFVSAMVLHRRFNLSQGFDGYDDELRREGEPAIFAIQERSGEHTMDRVLEWLSSASTKPEPYFLWVHLFDPHQPYAPPPDDAKLSPTLYDGEIASADRQVGRLVEALRQGKTLDDTIVVFTSDHGESLGEHDEATHALFIYESTVRVPLLFRYPQALPAGETFDGSVRGVDIMPTILGLAGLTPGDTQGADLSGALAGKIDPPAVVPYSESLHGQFEFAMAPLFGVRSESWTYIRAPRSELYNRTEDPGETKNLLDPSSPNREAALARASALDELVSEVLRDSERFGFVAEANPLDDETVKMLQALGYMDDSEAPSGLDGMDPKDGVRAFDEIDRARLLVLAGDYEEAKRVLHALLDWIPTNASARNLLALCEFRTNNAGAAKELYLQSLAYEPRQPEVLRQLGRIAIAEGDTSSARAHFLTSLEVDPGDVEAMMLIAYLDVQAGSLQDAKAWYEKAIAADPSYADSYLQYGNLYFRQGDFDRAKAWYEKALQLSPGSAAAATQAGLCALQTGDPEGAERHFTTAAKLEPSSWKPHFNLACAHAQRGNTNAAVSAIELAVALGFANAELLRQSPCFAVLRGSARFEALLASPSSPR